jgi:hypothetical protein
MTPLFQRSSPTDIGPLRTVFRFGDADGSLSDEPARFHPCIAAGATRFKGQKRYERKSANQT